MHGRGEFPRPLKYPFLPCLQVGNKNKRHYIPVEVRVICSYLITSIMSAFAFQFCEVKGSQRYNHKLNDYQTSQMLRVSQTFCVVSAICVVIYGFFRLLRNPLQIGKRKSNKRYATSSSQCLHNATLLAFFSGSTLRSESRSVLEQFRSHGGHENGGVEWTSIACAYDRIRKASKRVWICIASRGFDPGFLDTSERRRLEFTRRARYPRGYNSPMGGDQYGSICQWK